MINIETRVEAWKKRLLDLGKRNRLMNYRDTKRSNLKILSPDCFSLWQSFVQNEKPIEFPYYDARDDQEESIFFHAIETNQSIKEMQITLKVLRDKAKTAYEEQGVNILYLSFGFLKWTESADSDYWYTSPLVLVPVSLTVESISSPYILSLHEDEIVINPTLLYKLENDYGLALPSLNDDEDIKWLFSQIQTLVSPNKWEVIADSGLSLLSFLKINMYNDLEKHKDIIIANPIIRAISGDASASNKIPEDIIDFDFDNKLCPTETFQVVDADSSQQEAILCAKKGISFVLQGPPGTGKSQTITNIIAECLADGKKVLFVSEKMAALDVVHRRLTTAGLDDFCLILHSYKANKRAVLDQLGTTLSLAQKKAVLSDEAYQKLDLLQADKQKLNDYANQVFEVVHPLGKSIYEANGLLANLESYEDVIFSIDDIAAVDGQQYNRYNYLLSQFSDTVGKMSSDYNDNPWHSANVASVTNELRHDIASKLERLIPKVESANKEVAAIFHGLSLEWPLSYDALVEVVPLLNAAKQSSVVPVSWVLGSDIAPLFDEATRCEELNSKFASMQTELRTLYQAIAANDSQIDVSNIDALSIKENISNELFRMKNVMSSGFPYSKWNGNIHAVRTIFDEAKEKSTQLNELVAIMLREFEDSILGIDYNGIYSRYKTEYTSFFKIFKSSYKADKKTIQSQYKAIVKKVTDDMVLEVISKLRSIEDLRRWFTGNREALLSYFGDCFAEEKTNFTELEKYFYSHDALDKCVGVLSDMLDKSNEIALREDEVKAKFQFMYDGLNTDWGQTREALTWTSLFREQVNRSKCNREFVEVICSSADASAQSKAAVQKISETIDDMAPELLWYVSLFSNPNKIRELPLSALQDRLQACMDGLFLLEEWIDFRTAREHCQKEGLSDYISKIEDFNIDNSHIIPVFRKRFLRLWLDAVLPQYPAVLNFRRRVHEGTISEFANLDKMQFAIAKARIKNKLINSLPSLERFTSGVDEISVLKRELGKQRRIMPIRRLFREIPNLLLTLKPCLMMSPLSVSLFLETETYQFDTVIFDEASQVCTENAIGAISRAKQVIIAGDSKQLPPTNFFSASISSDTDYDIIDEDDYDDTDAYESILDEATLLPERTLLWHYRSRHEHLIAFSNAKIYKNNLITFPSNMDRIANHGVEYLFVKDGLYDRGGKRGNVIEAKKVAEMVFGHIQKYPNRSLGVIAFGEVQQMAIDTAVREMRLRNQQHEHFFKEDIDEPFFIKNLENVQGDERDAILFSIGYAKDAAGVFRMNFGPLSRVGGERRLNVAITRAKHNVKLVGSIRPTDIDLDRVSADGPKLLRAYIDFAMNGPEVLTRETTESDIVEHDSPFEASVYNFLDRKGYKLATQVGCSGYRIDMAVRHPTLNGIFVLGIECDGAAYHSARTARERDRLRQEVLEGMGWKIYRIWSTDWIKDCVTEGNRLTSAIEDAIANYGAIDEPSNEETTIELNPDDFVSVDEKVVSVSDMENPYGFEPPIKTSFSSLPRNHQGYLQIEDCIMLLVNEQFPLHYDLMCQRLASLYGREKATSVVRDNVNYGLRKLGGKVVRKGDFIFPAKCGEITVRVPNTRKIDHISVDELAQAMLTIATQCVGTNRESLCVETARVFGFNRTGQKITTAMKAACELLISQGKIKDVGGKLNISNGINSTSKVDAPTESAQKCSQCGTRHDLGDKFCGKCGNNI